VSSENDSVGSGGQPGWAVRLLLLLVEGYRVALSPLLGGHCRYWPSCSAYAEEAIRRHGARRGAALAVRRVLRCHPFRAGGFDPVP
jgi:putative membrane protein insertion efficiency factor